MARQVSYLRAGLLGFIAGVVITKLVERWRDAPPVRDLPEHRTSDK